MDINLQIKKEKLTGFKKVILKAYSLINNSESVTFAGLPRSGVNNIIEFLYKCYLEESNKKTVSLYDSDKTITIEEIENFIKNNKGKRKLLFLPYIKESSKEFIIQLDELIFNNKEDKIIFILHIDLLHLQNPYTFFKKSIKPFSNIILIKNRDFLGSTEVIQKLKSSYGYKIPSKTISQIHELSGGNIGIIKRLSQHYHLNGNLYINKLLISASVVYCLEELLDSSKELSNELLFELGLINKSGKYNSLLLEHYSRKNFESNFNLPPKLQTIFNLLINNKNILVTIDLIEKSLENENSLWSTYKNILRLRKIIAKQYRIVSVKSKGYILKDK